MADVWRDDDPVNNARQTPTVTVVVPTAEDRIAEKGCFTLFIKHVRTIRGEGFKYSVRSQFSGSTGDVVIGTDEATYERVKQAGLEALDRRHQELMDSVVEMRAANELSEDEMLEVAGEEWPPLGPGTRVRTTQLNESMIGEWTAEALAEKKWGVTGMILRHHDSHGLCYDVQHDDGTFGCYDPSEFEVVDQQ